MVSSATDVKLTRRRIPAIAAKLLSSGKATRFPARLDVCDVATGTLIAALVVIALVTCRDYAISNDEAVQHRYGELIIAYYASGLSDQSLFSFQNLYLYGGLFDIVAIALSHLFSVDPFDLRHIVCALIGISGIGAAALTARSIAGPRAALITTLTLSVTGAWYGAMFNHTKDIPFAAVRDDRRDVLPDPHQRAVCHRRATPTSQRSDFWQELRSARGSSDCCW